MLVTDVRSDNIGKTPFTVFQYHLWFSRYLQPFWYANEGNMTSNLQEWKLRKYQEISFCLQVLKYWKKFWKKFWKKLHRLLGVVNAMQWNFLMSGIQECSTYQGWFFQYQKSRIGQIWTFSTTLEQDLVFKVLLQNRILFWRSSLKQ